MTQIDTSNWGKFKVGELFEFERGKEVAPNKNLSGDCSLILESGENNGYSRNVIPTKIFDGNAITVSVNYAANVFYQENKFCASVNIIILRNKYLNKHSGLFIAAILSKNNSKYNYNDKISKDKLFNETISLPITSEGTPDFDYMEDYMKEITKVAAKRVEKLKEENPQTKIDINTWKKFKVGELFETINNNGTQVLTGANVPSKELKNGTTPRISVTGVNNGVVGYYDSTHKNYKVYNNFISVNFLGNAFYQENNASLDMKVHCLKLKNKELNKYLALFLVTIINKLTTSYSYANQLSSTSITQLQLPLPITPEGTPDFDYMENYMKNLTEKAKKKFSNIPQ